MKTVVTRPDSTPRPVHPGVPAHRASAAGRVGAGCFIIGAMPKTTIYHNPNCSTSRKALALLRERGLEPEVVPYLKTPPSAARLKQIAAATGEPLRALLRTKQPEYTAQHLDDPTLSDDAIAAAMVATPVLLERPIVVTDKGARLGRPVEKILEVL